MIDRFSLLLEKYNRKTVFIAGKDSAVNTALPLQ